MSERLSDPMKRELVRHASAVLRGFWVIPDDRSFNALKRRGLASRLDEPVRNTMLTPEGWAAVEEMLEPADAEVASYYATGSFVPGSGA